MLKRNIAVILIFSIFIDSGRAAPFLNDCLRVAYQKLKEWRKISKKEIVDGLPDQVEAGSRFPKRLKFIDETLEQIEFTTDLQRKHYQEILANSDLSEHNLIVIKNRMAGAKAAEGNEEIIEAYMDYLVSLNAQERRIALELFPEIVEQAVPLNLTRMQKLDYLVNKMKVMVGNKNAKKQEIINAFLVKQDKFEKFQLTREKEIYSKLVKENKFESDATLKRMAKDQAKSERKLYQHWHSRCLKKKKPLTSSRAALSKRLKKREAVKRALRIKSASANMKKGQALIKLSKEAAGKQQKVFNKILKMLGLNDSYNRKMIAASMGASGFFYTGATAINNPEKFQDGRFYMTAAYEVFMTGLYALVSSKVLNNPSAKATQKYLTTFGFKAGYDVIQSGGYTELFKGFISDYSEANNEVMEKLTTHPEFEELMHMMEEFVKESKMDERFSEVLVDSFEGVELTDEDFDDPEIMEEMLMIYAKNMADKYAQDEYQDSSFWDRWEFNRYFNAASIGVDLAITGAFIYKECMGMGKQQQTARRLFRMLLMSKVLINGAYYGMRPVFIGY
jgi:hypothetical protein